MVLTLNNFVGFETEGAEEASAVAGTPTYETTNQRTGGAALLLDAATEEFSIDWAAPGVTNGGADYVVGFGVRKSANPGSATDIFDVLDDSGDVILTVRLNTNGSVGLLDQGATLLDTTAVLSNDVWYFFEVYAQLGNASGAWEWFRDTISEGSGVGADFEIGAFGGTGSVSRFSGAAGITLLFDDYYNLSGVVAVADRFVNVEVLSYQNNQGASATPDGGFGAAGTDLDTGTWDLVAQTPLVNSGGNVAIYGSAGAGTVDLTGPSGDSNIDGDENIGGIKGIWNAQRSNGGSSVHSVALGNDGDGNAPPETIITPIVGYGNFFVFRETDLPLSSDLIRQGFETTGNRDFDCGDMWAMLLHVPNKVSETTGNLSDVIQGTQNFYAGPFEI